MHGGLIALFDLEQSLHAHWMENLYLTPEPWTTNLRTITLNGNWCLVQSESAVVMNTFNIVYEGEWVSTAITFTNETGADGITLPIKYSLCVGWDDSARSDIVADAPKNIIEPVLGQIQVNGTINTTAIQKQLGVSQGRKQDLQTFGIFNLKMSDTRTKYMSLYGPLQYWSAFH